MRCLFRFWAVVILVGCGSDGIRNYSGPYSSPQTGPSVTTSPTATPTPIPVTTLAGEGSAGDIDANGRLARFANPVNVDTDAQGNLYICDFDNNTLRRMNSNRDVSTLVRRGDFERPFGVAFGPDGNVYVETDANDLGSRDGTTGTIWRVSPTTGSAAVVVRDVGRPRGLCFTNDGRLVLCNLSRHVVELLNPTTGTITFLAGSDGLAGFNDGSGAIAMFSRPYGPAIAPNGDILLADQDNNRIRRVTLAGQVSTFAGTGVAGNGNGARLSATFDHPEDLAVDSAGNVYVSDNLNHLLRKIDSSGNVTTLAGSGTAGFADGQRLQAQFFGQEGLCVSSSGNALIVADGTGGGADPFNRVRQVLLP